MYKILKLYVPSCNTKQIGDAQRRIEELNLIIKRLHEDKVTGKISDERFALLSGEYEARI